MPTPAASRPMIVLSIISCRTMCPRVAPSASLSDTSRSREAPRASRRLARFVRDQDDDHDDPGHDRDRLDERGSLFGHAARAILNVDAEPVAVALLGVERVPFMASSMAGWREDALASADSRAMMMTHQERGSVCRG